MIESGRVALIGNSLPRRCGIATFTTDLQQALKSSGAEASIVAMTDPGRAYDYPSTVCLEVREERTEDYARAAAFVNAGRFDVACVQHEFGIFGGEAGSQVMALLSRLTVPIVTTLHTVLAEPSEAQRRVMAGLIGVSARIVVMAEKGRSLLRSVYHAPADNIEVIPHGIPAFPFVEPDSAKKTLGFSDRSVILTFGLLSPNKGIEVMIDAMPSILAKRPDAVYVVLGATHPNLVRDHGEAYRSSLCARVRQLGVEDHVVFLDQFVDQATLLGFISMCDVYVTPYLNEAQMTSGTLAYSFGLGKAVVSTPYWHARELLADGRGILVPFGDATTTALEVAGLLTDDARRRTLRERAYAASRSMIWDRTGENYLTTFAAARRSYRKKTAERRTHAVRERTTLTPQMQVGHLLSMCDDTGLFQHAVHSVPNRSHGYCVDDNARALLVACALNQAGEQRLPEIVTSRLAAFVQDAWNPDTQRFRNFMSFDRRWLEDLGSEDSHGRTLWALGECARSDACPSRRRWAAALFKEALPDAERFQSPRTWAFMLLGLDAYCAVAEDSCAQSTRVQLADRLLSIMARVETADWVWFEEELAYDNARLSQALIVTGMAVDNPDYVAAGLRSLRWLMSLQTTVAGIFRPIGTDSFGENRKSPSAFDQQPLEATAAISACLAAWRAESDPEWKVEAERVFAWFHGGNDLSLPMVDLDTGSCRDGLHPDRANENRGGESVVSYLLSLAEIRELARSSGDLSRHATVHALRA